MKLKPSEFRAWENKCVSLLGMSGVGKTQMAKLLQREGWFHYSGDYRIGTRYLGEPILDNIKRQAMSVPFLRELLRTDSIYIANNVTVDNLTPVSSFLGKLGDPLRGGLNKAEFKRRQALYRAAETAAMKDVPGFIDKARVIYGYQHFVNDAGGSICELGDEEPIRVLAENTLILYIRADKDMEETLVQRAIDDPKPLYYEESFLDARLAEYLRAESLRSVGEIDPDRFVRWIFPKLLEHRRPLYQGIADEHGYTVEARDVERVRDERDFIELVSRVLGAAEAPARRAERG